MKDIFFIAGCYGVGKTFLSKLLSDSLSIKYYDSSELITLERGESYNLTKGVCDKEKNQRSLISSVDKILSDKERIILTGHFCIFDKNNHIEVLPEFVFENLSISKIVLLESTPSIIVKNLNSRDAIKYGIFEIEELIKEENKMALIISKMLKVPLLIHQMKYNKSDYEQTLKFLILGE